MVFHGIGDVVRMQSLYDAGGADGWFHVVENGVGGGDVHDDHVKKNIEVNDLTTILVSNWKTSLLKLLTCLMIWMLLDFGC